MNTWWNNRRFTLLNTEAIARVEELADKCGVSPRTYLGELIEMACYELKKKTSEIEPIVDTLVVAWLAVHRSGRPCILIPPTKNDCDEYMLGEITDGHLRTPQRHREISITEYLL